MGGRKVSKEHPMGNNEDVCRPWGWRELDWIRELTERPCIARANNKQDERCKVSWQRWQEPDHALCVISPEDSPLDPDGTGKIINAGSSRWHDNNLNTFYHSGCCVEYGKGQGSLPIAKVQAKDDSGLGLRVCKRYADKWDIMSGQS